MRARVVAAIAAALIWVECAAGSPHPAATARVLDTVDPLAAAGDTPNDASSALTSDARPSIVMAAKVRPEQGLEFTRDAFRMHLARIDLTRDESSWNNDAAGNWQVVTTHRTVDPLYGFAPSRTLAAVLYAADPDRPIVMLADEDDVARVRYQFRMVTQDLAATCFLGRTVRVGDRCTAPILLANGSEANMDFVAESIDREANDDGSADEYLVVSGRTENDTRCDTGYDCHEVRSVRARVLSGDCWVRSEDWHIDASERCPSVAPGAAPCAVRELVRARWHAHGGDAPILLPDAGDANALNCGDAIVRGTDARSPTLDATPTDASVPRSTDVHPIDAPGALISIDSSGIVSIAALDRAGLVPLGRIDAHGIADTLVNVLDRGRDRGLDTTHVYFRPSVRTTLGQARALLARIATPRDVRWVVRSNAPDEASAVREASAPVLRAIASARADAATSMVRAAYLAIRARAGNCATLASELTQLASATDVTLVGDLLDATLRGVAGCSCAVDDAGLVVDLARVGSNPALRESRWTTLPEGPDARVLVHAPRRSAR